MIINPLNAFSVLDDERMLHAELGETIKYYRVVNYSAYEENISLRLEDVVFNNAKTISRSFSCKKFVNLSVNSFKLLPGEMKTVEVLFDVPEMLGEKDFLVNVFFNEKKKTIIYRNFFCSDRSHP